MTHVCETVADPLLGAKNPRQFALDVTDVTIEAINTSVHHIQSCRLYSYAFSTIEYNSQCNVWLARDGHGGATVVNFCPWCGLKLEIQS